jgi:hypothetical protein
MENAMARIVVSENVSLDGVVEDPAGDEGSRVGGWVGLIKDLPQLNKLALDEALGADALLLGRRRRGERGLRRDERDEADALRRHPEHRRRRRVADLRAGARHVGLRVQRVIDQAAWSPPVAGASGGVSITARVVRAT